MKLTEADIQRIREYVDDSGITIPTLRDDVVDHLICVIESERAGSFDQALQRAVAEVAPQGLRKIEHETILLLNPIKILRMKKFMYSVGLFSAASVSLGWLFLILHWPGGTELFNYGFLGLLLVFMPLLAIDRFKFSLRKALTERLRIILGFASALVVGVALALKFLRLPGADQLLIAGFILFTFGFLPFLFFNLYRRSVTRAEE